MIFSRNKRGRYHDETYLERVVVAQGAPSPPTRPRLSLELPVPPTNSIPSLVRYCRMARLDLARALLLAALLPACIATPPPSKDAATDDSAAGHADDDCSSASTCDCTDASVSYDAVEICDGIDNNCDGEIDEGVTSTYYADVDGDGYGDPDPAATQVACENPAGFVPNSTDCDDTTADAYPGATEVCDGLDNNCDGQVDEGVGNVYFSDADADGFGDPAGGVRACETPAGYVTDATDCDDASAASNPAEEEVCDERDNDCDGTVDEDVTLAFYADIDGDGYGDDSVIEAECVQPTGYAEDGGDCDDVDPDVFPGAAELCNGVDDDCNGAIDDGTGATTTWYADADADSFGAAATSVLACTAPAAHVTDATDCDDADAAVNPDAIEVCNAIDDDCDGTSDVGAIDATIWYADADADAYGAAATFRTACTAPPDYVADATDCDDAAVTVNPGAAEVCDGVDNDCDGTADIAAIDAATWYSDADADAYGAAATYVIACAAPASHVPDATDCDDSDATINPAAAELCDGVDNDCNGLLDDGLTTTTWYADDDGDGYGGAAGTDCTRPSGAVDNAWDCDDTDATITPGGSASCAWPSCLDLLTDGIASTDGDYWIDFDGTPTQTSCDMTADGGGWTLIFADDFEAAPSAGWSISTTYACAGWSNILGGYGTLSGGEVGITVDTWAIAHSDLWLTLDYVKLDSWDGELAYVEVDATRLWSQNLNYYEGSEVCGWNRGWSGSYDDLHAISVTTPHTGGSAELVAGSTLDQDAGDESFGIDDVVAWIR